MKKRTLTLLALMAIGALRVACAQGDGSPSGTAVSPVYPDPNAVPEGSVKIGVQITEVGCMRTLLLLDSGAEKFEKLIDQRLTEVDFRVFPSAQIVDSRISAADMRQYGNQNQADLVLYATVSTRLKNSMGDFQLFEGEATVQIYSPVSGELMVSQTDRDNGVRNVDPVEAERSAAERAVDLSVQEAIVRGLERAQKLIVHTATITGVQDNNQLLIIMNYLEKMEGIYQVRQISFDRASQVAQIEIIGSPKSDTDWRAFLERMPRTKIVHMEVHSNPDLHSERTYPSWFKPAGN